MGFFSQDCHGCGDSIVAPYDIPAGLEWQNIAVAIPPTGGTVKTGPYDGYGSVGDEGDTCFDIGGENTVWHRACWAAAGKPDAHQGASRSSVDQGYFYDRVTATNPPPDTTA